MRKHRQTTLASILILVILVISLGGCGGGSTGATKRSGIPVAVTAVDESGPPSSGGALAVGPPPSALTADAAPTASGRAAKTATPSTPVAAAAPLAAAAVPSITAGLGDAGQGWFQHFGVAASSLLGGDWGRIPLPAHQAATYAATGDVDGDGNDEIVVGTAGSGQGTVYVFKRTTEGCIPFATITLTDFAAYTASGDAPTYPACVDLDGGASEIVVGTGPRGQGFAQVFTFDAAAQRFVPFAGTPYAHGWMRVAWAGYADSGNAPVYPAGGRLRGTSKGQVVLGLGDRGQGWMQVFEMTDGLLKPCVLAGNASGWLQVGWSKYTGGAAPTYPAVGDVDGDGRDDLVVGLGDRGEGWLETFTSTGTDLRAASWTQVPWSTYAASSRAATHPSTGDLDGDGRADLVVGLGNAGQGWMYYKTATTSGWKQIEWSAFDSSGQSATWPSVMRGRDLQITALQLTPAVASMPVGTRQAFTATIVLENGRTVNVTQAVKWSVSGGLALDGSGGALATSSGAAVISATLGNRVATATVTVTPAALASIGIDPTAPTVARGLSVQLTATGIYTDGSHRDLTSQVRWESADPAVSVSASGLARGVDVGGSLVSATLDGVSNATRVTVTAATIQRLEVTPRAASGAQGQSCNFRAAAVLSDGSVQDVTALAAWSTSDASVLAISNAEGSVGRATLLRPGVVEVVARHGGSTDRTSFTVTPAVVVSVAITPPSSGLPLGVSADLHAVAAMSDGTTRDVTREATWTSSQASRIAVSNADGSRGRVTALGLGDAVVTAVVGGCSAHVTVTGTAAVLRAVQVSPPAASLPRGLSQPMTAIGLFSDDTTRDLTREATWQSDRPLVVSVSNAEGTQGRCSAIDPGTAEVSATVDGIRGTAAVTVTPACLQSLEVSPARTTLPRGLTCTLQAVGLFSDGTREDLTTSVLWSTSDASRATVSNADGQRGLLSARGEGDLVVTATRGELYARAMVTVTSAVLVSIEVTPPAPALPEGLTQPLTATGLYSDGSRRTLTCEVTWTSSDERVATVSNDAAQRGLLRGCTPGAATIRATLGDVVGVAPVRVNEAALVSLQVSPPLASIPAGLTQPFTARGCFTDGSTRDLTQQVTWRVEGDAAAVSNAADARGLVTALVPGTATVHASLGEIEASAAVTATSALLRTLQITPALLTLPKGTSQRLSASGLYSDGTTRDLTHEVSWRVDDPDVVAVGNGDVDRGLCVAVSEGQTAITASVGQVSATAPVTVTAARLQALELSPSSARVPAGLTQTFRAIAVFTDGTRQDVTDTATWSASGPATVSNASGSAGVASTSVPGPAVVTATLQVVSASATLDVGAATLAGLVVRPDLVSLALGTRASFQATGLFTDGTTCDVTTAVTWSSSSGSVSLSNEPGAQGTATPLALGTAVVSATLGEMRASATCTVTPATLSTITVSPATASIPLGLTQRLTATGTFSDGTTRDLTGQVTWESDAATIAVSNGDLRGVATAMALGEATVSARLDGVCGTARVRATAAVLREVQMTPDTSTCYLGATLDLHAVGVYSDGSTADVSQSALWASSDVRLATVSSISPTAGRVRGLYPGDVVVEAFVGSVGGAVRVHVSEASLTSLTLAPSPAAVAPSRTVALRATALWSDGQTSDVTASAAWSSSDTAVATVSPSGVVTGGRVGQARITATQGSLYAQVTVNVAIPLATEPLYRGTLAFGAVTDMKASADGRTLYALADGQLRFIDVDTLTVREVVSVGSSPRTIELSPDGHSAIVADGGAPRVFTVDLETGSTRAYGLTKITAASAAVFMTGKRAYVAGGDYVTALDLDSGTEVYSFYWLHAVLLAADRVHSKLFVAMTGWSPSSIARYNVSGATPKLEQEVRDGSNGRMLALSPLCDTIVFPCGGGSPATYGYITNLYSTASFGTILGHWSLGTYPLYFAFMPDGSRVVALNGDAYDRNVYIASTRDFTDVSRFQPPSLVGTQNPTLLAISGDGHRLFVFSRDTYWHFTYPGNIYFYDLP